MQGISQKDFFEIRPAPRSMSEAQESAQLLAGQELPRIVLEPLLQGIEISGSEIGILNYTPYDGYLEKACVNWQKRLGMDAYMLKSFSFGSNTDAVMFSERVVCNELLQERSQKNSAIISKTFI